MCLILHPKIICSLPIRSRIKIKPTQCALNIICNRSVFCENHNHTSSVTAMTVSLSWETFQHRRQQDKAIMMFRIIHAMVAIPAFPRLQLLGAATRGHQYRIPYCRTNTYKDFFLPTKYQTVEPSVRKADKC